jgi:hypothetical protein
MTPRTYDRQFGEPAFRNPGETPKARIEAAHPSEPSMPMALAKRENDAIEPDITDLPADVIPPVIVTYNTGGFVASALAALAKRKFEWPGAERRTIPVERRPRLGRKALAEGMAAFAARSMRIPDAGARR